MLVRMPSQKDLKYSTWGWLVDFRIRSVRFRPQITESRYPEGLKGSGLWGSRRGLISSNSRNRINSSNHSNSNNIHKAVIVVIATGNGMFYGFQGWGLTSLEIDFFFNVRGSQTNAVGPYNYSLNPKPSGTPRVPVGTIFQKPHVLFWTCQVQAGPKNIGSALVGELMSSLVLGGSRSTNGFGGPV